MPNGEPRPNQSPNGRQVARWIGEGTGVQLVVVLGFVAFAWDWSGKDARWKQRVEDELKALHEEVAEIQATPPILHPSQMDELKSRLGPQGWSRYQMEAWRDELKDENPDVHVPRLPDFEP